MMINNNCYCKKKEREGGFKIDKRRKCKNVSPNQLLLLAVIKVFYQRKITFYILWKI